MKGITIPMGFMRDYTIPSGDQESWDRTRSAVIPMTLVFAFEFLNGNIYQADGGPEEDGADADQEPHWSG